MLLALSVFVLAVAAGMPMGYPTVLLPQLYQSNDSLQMDTNMYSWFGKATTGVHERSAVNLGGLFVTNKALF